MTARTGKIARLPRSIRDALNRRLEEGESGVELVAWLNGQPAVRDILESGFGGRPISQQNLSEWRKGGFVEWRKHQESMALARDLCANADELTQLSDESLSDMLSPLLIARYMAVISSLGADGGDANDWRVLRELCGDVIALRKGDHSAERLKLERERLRLGFVS